MLVIYGPTATGKTNLAIKLAKKFGGEVISADSRQVYKDLDIGSGKVSFESKVEKHDSYWIVDSVKINGFDLVPAGYNFTVFDFLNFASSKIDELKKNNKLPIVAGGTGFYIKSLFKGIETIGIEKNPDLRQKLEKLTVEELFQKLKKIDIHRARRLNSSDRKNSRRLIRAIEVAMAPKRTESNVKTYRFQDSFVIGLTATNQVIFQKAENWINERLKNGLIKEVEGLIKRGVDEKWLESLGLEYRWFSRYVIGKDSYDDSIKHLISDYHSFVRRQKAWFSHLDNIELFDITEKSWSRKLEKAVTVWYTRKKHG